MPTFSIELDSIDAFKKPPDEKMKWQDPRIWHPTWMRIGLDDPALFVDPLRSPALSPVGTAVFRQLSTIGGLGVWFPDVEDTRRAGKFSARYDDLPLLHGVGFGPALDSLMLRIVRRLAECGLGDCIIDYTVGERAHWAQSAWPIGYCDSSNWPKSTSVV